MDDDDGAVKLPRKALGAYMHFVKSNRARVVEANDGMQLASV